MIATPVHETDACLVTDGGGAHPHFRPGARRRLQRPVYVLGTGESVETPMISQMEDFTLSSKAFRRWLGVRRSRHFPTNDVDHLMIYDAFTSPFMVWKTLASSVGARGPISFWDRHTAIGGSPAQHQRWRLVLHALRDVRDVRLTGERQANARTAPAQAEGAEISVAHGVGGMFAASGTIIFGR
ncbi:MAG: hypothetical protein R2706_19220 [Acidimicrobiales bacterium]